MNKIITVLFSFSLTAFGMSYEEFKTYTQKNAKTLQSQALSLQTTKEENKILLRTKNPKLNLEASRFDPDAEDSSFGYSVIASQDIRTGNYYDSLTKKADASFLLQEAYVKEGKSGYIRTLEKIYTEYVYQSKLYALLQQEYALSDKVSNMVQQRYKNGSENKVAYLQAKTDTLALKTQIYTTKQEMSTLYHQLLAIAGLDKRVPLDKYFIYTISSQMDMSKNANPKQQILHAKEKLLESQIQMNESTIYSYELFGGIEEEPDQSIVRLGLSIPVPIFNDRSEEKMLAKLQMQQLSLDKEQLAIDMHTQQEIIEASIRSLSKQYSSLQTLKNEQVVLNELLQEGYQIAQGSIFVMMSSKNKLIQTQKSLLQTHKMINDQKIELRFLQGSYND